MGKIAILTPVFPPYRGGIGKLAELDATQLRELGHEVTIFVPRQPGIPDAAHVTRLKPWYRNGNAALVPSVAGLLKSHDLVMLNYPFFGGAEPLALTKHLKSGGRLALVYHMDMAWAGWRGAIARAHHRFCEPWVLSAADRVIVTSFDYARHSNLGPMISRNESRFRELAPSVDSGRFLPGGKPMALLKRYGLSANDRVVLFVGGLDQAHYFKGVPNIVRAMAMKTLAGVKAVIVGEGDLKPGFIGLARELGSADRVIFAGAVSEEELPDHYRLGDVFVLASVDKSEAFGLAALEALSSGLPVVASDLPGVRTIVRRGETGACVPPGSVSALAARLAELLDDDSQRQRFGENARRMAVEEYSHEARRRKLGVITSELLKRS
jgi:glycosyltransferase involved in cell wall biosynthesis